MHRCHHAFIERALVQVRRRVAYIFGNLLEQAATQALIGVGHLAMPQMQTVARQTTLSSPASSRWDDGAAMSCIILWRRQNDFCYRRLTAIPITGHS